MKIVCSTFGVQLAEQHAALLRSWISALLAVRCSCPRGDFGAAQAVDRGRQGSVLCAFGRSSRNPGFRVPRSPLVRNMKPESTKFRVGTPTPCKGISAGEPFSVGPRSAQYTEYFGAACSRPICTLPSGWWCPKGVTARPAEGTDSMNPGLGT